MNMSLGISVAIFAGTSTLGISSPSALLEWKDPGYLPQIARAFLAETKGKQKPGFRFRTPNGDIGFLPDSQTSRRIQHYPPATFPDSTDLTQSLSSFRRALSEPFHLSIDYRLPTPSPMFRNYGSDVVRESRNHLWRE